MFALLASLENAADNAAIKRRKYIVYRLESSILSLFIWQRLRVKSSLIVSGKAKANRHRALSSLARRQNPSTSMSIWCSDLNLQLDLSLGLSTSI